MSRETELQRAINQKCLECSGGMHGEIRDCRIRKCALYGYRPFQRATPAQRQTIGGTQISVFEVLEASQ